MTAVLYIGNRNYSSWSLRGALLVAQSGIDCREEVIPLDTAESRAQLRAVSPTGLVPVLHYRGTVVWETLAIAEFLHDEVPEAGLWPRQRDARALARSISAEMHAGFAALRRECPMDIRATAPKTVLDPQTRADVARIERLWQECRERHGAGGDFLFGAWCAADAMFAPVVTRFRTYAIPLDAEAQRYADAVWEWPELRRWAAQAREEPWHLSH